MDFETLESPCCRQGAIVLVSLSFGVVSFTLPTGTLLDILFLGLSNDKAHLPGPLQELDVTQNQSCGSGQVQRLVRP